MQSITEAENETRPSTGKNTDESPRRNVTLPNNTIDKQFTIRPTTNEDQTSITSIMPSIMPSSPISGASVSISTINATACTTTTAEPVTFSKLNHVPGAPTDINPFLEDTASIDAQPESASDMDVPSPNTTVPSLSPPPSMASSLNERKSSFLLDTATRYTHYGVTVAGHAMQGAVVSAAAFLYLLLLLAVSLREANPLRERHIHSDGSAL